MRDTYVDARAAFQRAGIIQEDVLQEFESDKETPQFWDTIKVVLKRWICIEKKYGMGQVSGKNLS